MSTRRKPKSDPAHDPAEEAAEMPGGESVSHEAMTPATEPETTLVTPKRSWSAHV